MLPEYTLADDVLTDLVRLQFSKFLNVAALAIFAYDYCLTFSTEVEYVWGTKWGLTRIVFTLSRYLPFISCPLTFYGVLANEGCGSFIVALDVFYMFNVVFSEGILMLRTYALWGCSKKVLIFLLLLTGAFISSAEVLGTLVEFSLPGDSTSYFQFYTPECAGPSSRSGAIQYGLLVVYEIVLQSMNSWRRFRKYRDHHSRVLNTLYWDGMMYMWWIIVLSAANTAVRAAAPIAYVSALTTAQLAIQGLLASRIFFNLRQVHEQTMTLGSEFSLEGLRFRAAARAGATTQAEMIDMA